MSCPEGFTRYQARANVMVENVLQEYGTVRCHPPTAEVSNLIAAGLLVGEVDGEFPSPVEARARCCGH